MGSEAGENGSNDAAANGKSLAGGKGKGVSRSELDEETSKQTSDDSIMARLGKSAGLLSASVFRAAPSVHDLGSASSSAKTGGSSSSGKFDARAETSIIATAPSSSGSKSFRSGQADTHAAAEEAAFSDFLDNTGVFVPTESSALEKAWEANLSIPTGRATYESSLGASAAEQQGRDGLEVVQLLSQADEEVPEFERERKLSEDELRSLRHALFEAGSPAQVSASDWNNMLNFIPDFLRGQDAIQGRTVALETTFMNLGLTGQAEAVQQWLAEWNRVLTSYNDEVWGDLGDLVQLARTEVRRIRNGQEGRAPDPVALRRLQSVLTRVRARL
ncbi:unnamed protein product [Discula destructiva]